MSRPGLRLALLVVVEAGCRAPSGSPAGLGPPSDQGAGGADSGGDGDGGGVAPVDADADGVPAGEDCDDGEPATYPGAPELPDLRDQDCDGGLGTWPMSAFTWLTLTGAEEEQFIGAVALGDVDGDGLADVVVSSAYAGLGGNAAPGRDAGAVWLLTAIELAAMPSGASLSIAEVVPLMEGSWDGDLDGDGVVEQEGEGLGKALAIAGGRLLVGAPWSHGVGAPDPSGVADVGAVWALEGSAASAWTGGTQDGQVGYALHGVADVPGGALVMASGIEGPCDPDCQGVGAVLLFAVEEAAGALPGAGLRLTGGADDRQIGHGPGPLGHGDIDGDGLPELAIGARYSGDGGGVWLVEGAGVAAAMAATPGADLSLPDVGVWLAADTAGDDMGAALVLSDIDGDGSSELIVGAPGAGLATGEVRVWGAAALRDALDGSPAGPDARWSGEEEGSEAGSMVLAAAADDDGFDDVWVSAFRYGLTGTDIDSATQAPGRVYLLRGGAGLLADRSLGDADLLLDGDVGNAGGHLSAGDVDLDGRDELLVAAPHADLEVPRAGQVMLLGF